MDTNPNINTGEPGVPPDLSATGASLDRLAGAERAGAGPSFEDRVFLATRAAIAQGVPADIADVAGLLDELATTERAGAPVTLEDRLMLATAAHLCRGAKAPMRLRPSVTVAWRSWSARAAAAALVMAAGVTVWVVTRPASQEMSLASVKTALQNVSLSLSETPAAFADLHRDLDSLDQSVKGDWFRTDSISDEESL